MLGARRPPAYPSQHRVPWRRAQLSTNEHVWLAATVALPLGIARALVQGRVHSSLAPSLAEVVPILRDPPSTSVLIHEVANLRSGRSVAGIPRLTLAVTDTMYAIDAAIGGRDHGAEHNARMAMFRCLDQSGLTGWKDAVIRAELALKMPELMQAIDWQYLMSLDAELRRARGEGQDVLFWPEERFQEFSLLTLQTVPAFQETLRLGQP